MSSPKIAVSAYSEMPDESDHMSYRRSAKRVPLCASPDVDAFLGIFSNNLATILVTLAILGNAENLGPDLVYKKLLPGFGIQFLWGCLHYCWMAYRMSVNEHRSDVCAQPIGVNTPIAFAIVNAVILPVLTQCKQKCSSGDTQCVSNCQEVAWKAGVTANLIVSIVKVTSALYGPMLKQFIPDTALLVSLMGISFAFLALAEEVILLAEPLAALLPFAITMVGYLADVGFHIPGTNIMIPTMMISLVTGTIIGWTTGVNSSDKLGKASSEIGFHPPVWVTPFSEIKDVVNNLNNVAPMCIVSILSTLQCIESSAKAGDKYGVKESMLAEGLANIVGCLFGSVWHLTAYIGHPAFKQLGARVGYQVANGMAFCLIGFIGLADVMLQIITLQSVVPIIIFVGLIIGSEVLAVTPIRHIPALFLGLIPSIANYCYQSIAGAVQTTYEIKYTNEICDRYFNATNPCPTITPTQQEYHLAGLEMGGLQALSNGSLLLDIMFCSIMIYLIDRKFHLAGLWTTLSALFSLIGLIHGEKLKLLIGADESGWKFAVGYGTATAFFLFLFVLQRYELVLPPRKTAGKTTADRAKLVSLE